MSLFLLDTDTLSLLERGNPTVLRHVNNHPTADISVSAITVQEQMQGFLAALRRAKNRTQSANAYDLLVTRLLPTWNLFEVVSFTESAMVQFEQLKSLRLNVGMMDLRIAAIGLENKLTVVTRNSVDFNRVTGLTTEDWSV